VVAGAVHNDQQVRASAPLYGSGAQQAQVFHELLGAGAAQDFLGGFFLRFEERGDRFGAQAGLLLADGAVGEQVGAALAWEVGEGGAGDVGGDGDGVRAFAQLDVGGDPVELAAGRAEAGPQLVAVEAEPVGVFVGLVQEAGDGAGECGGPDARHRRRHRPAHRRPAQRAWQRHAQCDPEPVQRAGAPTSCELSHPALPARGTNCLASAVTTRSTALVGRIRQ
jgi:hypothetical protein